MTVVPTVEDKAVSTDDRLGAEVLPVGPEHGACCGAGGAHDALGRIVKALTLGGRLQALTLGSRTGRHKEGHDLAVGREERLHVDDEVLLHRQARDRLDEDWLRRVEVLQQRLAGEAVARVDAHRIGTTHAVCAGASERERAILLPLDLVKCVKDPVGRVSLDLELFPVLLARSVLTDTFGVHALDAQCHRHGGDFGGDGGVVDNGHCQYFRSIGLYLVMVTGL